VIRKVYRRGALSLVAAVGALPLLHCGMSEARNEPSPPAAAPAGSPGVEPQRIQVQHILVGFSGSVPGKRITRSQDEAKTLAYDILKRAQGGADFNALVREHTDDSPPGIYGMSNRGVAAAQGEFQREGMVAAFGDVGFTLPVGGYGVADFDPRSSPFGYHVIKRLK
jgi:parvulin-like peptidyl-prolyl isomerase